MQSDPSPTTDGTRTDDTETRFAERAVERTDAPADRPCEVLDVRELGPPEPLTETLETLADSSDDTRTLLVQVNDRAPQHLYPKLTDRGYEFETVGGDETATDDETITDEEVVLTAVWRDE